MPRTTHRSVLEQLEPRMFLSAANDMFAGRTPITALPATITDTNVDATAQDGEPAHKGLPAERSVWYTWTAPKGGTYRITTAGSDFDTVLAVYRGKTLSSLKPVAADDDADRAAGSSIVTVKAPAKTTYQIAVDGFQGATGNITLSIARANPLVINGTNDNDIIRVTAEGTNYVVDINGTQKTYGIATVRTLRINGGNGNDRISLGARVIGTTIFGGAGDDVLIGGDNADRILGEAGNDEIYGSFGNDTLDGGAGNDTIDGQRGDDSIIGGAGTDQLAGGDGNDRIIARDKAIDSVDGGDGSDTVRADANDVLTNVETLLK